MNRKTFLTLTITLLLQQFCFSQDKFKDSIENLTYKEIKSGFYKFIEVDSIALKYANAHLKRSKKEFDTLKIADSYLYKSRISNFENAIKYSDSIILLTNSVINKKYPALGYLMKGNFYYNKGKDKEATSAFVTAYKYATRNKNEKQILYIQQSIANIKVINKEYKEALKTYKAHLESILSMPEYETEYIEDYLYALDNISKVYLNMKILDSASLYNYKGLFYSKKNNYNKFYYSFLLNNGTLNYFDGNFKEALDSLDKVRPNLNNEGLLMNYYYSGKISEKDDVKSAINYFLKVDSIYNEIEIPSAEIQNTYKILHHYYQKENDETKQLKFLKKIIKIDSFLNSDRKNINNDLLKNYEIPKLKNEKIRLENLIKTNNKNRILIITCLSIILILLLIFTTRFYKKQKLYKKRYDDIISFKGNIETKKNLVHNIENLNIPKNVVKEILISLNQFEKNKDFLENGVTLNSVSKNLKTNSSYLSKIINHYKEQSFSNYLNSLRIDYAINELKNNSKFRNYTISAIAQEVGFNTAESFSKHFHKEKGIYPSYFIKKLNKS